MEKFKNYFCLAIVLTGIMLLTSCSNDKDEPTIPIMPSTSYTVVIESSVKKIAQNSGLTAKVDYNFIEYNDANEIIDIKDWNDVPDGIFTKQFTANPRATKLVIRFKVYAYKNGSEVASEIMYYVRVYYLDKNKNLDISLNGNSKVSSSSPI